MHQKDGEYYCVDCNKTYKNCKTLETHVKKYHTSINAHKCHQCEQLLPNQKALDSHIRKAHTLFPCSKCHKVYKSNATLRYHKFNHVPEFPFICDVLNCGKAFKNPKRRTEHKYRTHNAPIYKLMCEVCGYRTDIRCNLTVHQRTHTAEKPYCCDVCGNCFASLYQLRAHKYSHLDARSRRTHKCAICGAAFLNAKTLHHHKVLHLEQKKFVCSLCGNAFAQAAGYSQHMRRHKAIITSPLSKSDSKNLKHEI